MRSLAVVVFFVVACGQPNHKSTIQSEVPKQKEWYEGGTLHKATIAEWKAATESNKLATCADFVASLEKPSSMDAMLDQALALKNCINEATEGISAADKESVVDIASACTILLREGL